MSETLTVREAYLHGKDHLGASGSSEPGIEAEVLLRHVLGVDRARLYTEWETAIPRRVWQRYREVLAERAAGRPVHYIVGEREFMGLAFRVDERVLIPRPDTEVLVEYLLEHLNGQAPGPRPQARPLVLVDVGTGSGCIAVSLAHALPDAAVYAIDVSAPALEVAAINAVRHAVAGRITFLHGAFLEPMPAGLMGRVDVVASNLPYVPPAQRDLLPREIRDHEPPVAIFAPGTGTENQHRLIADAAAWLSPGGVLAMEVGAGQAGDVVAAMRNDARYADVRTQADYVGITRMVSGTRL